MPRERNWDAYLDRLLDESSGSSPPRSVSPPGSSRYENSTRYHTSSRTYDVRPSVDYSRQAEELLSLERRGTISRSPTRRSSTSRRRYADEDYGSYGVDMSTLGGGLYDTGPSTRPSRSERARENLLDSYISGNSSGADTYRYESEASRYSQPSNSERLRRALSPESTNRYSDVYVPDSLRLGSRPPRDRYDETYPSRLWSEQGPSTSYSTRDITPGPSSGDLRRSHAVHRRHR